VTRLLLQRPRAERPLRTVIQLVCNSHCGPSLTAVEEAWGRAPGVVWCGAARRWSKA